MLIALCALSSATARGDAYDPPVGGGAPRVVGDYSGIVRFLNHLQRSKNTYIVDTLQVDTASSGQGPAGTLKIGLKILTYFRKA